METKLARAGSVIGLSMKENFRFTVDAGFIDDDVSVVGVEVYRSCLGLKNKLCRRKLLKPVLCPVNGARDSPRVQQYKMAGGGMVTVVIGVHEEGFTKIGTAGGMNWAMSDYAMDGAAKDGLKEGWMDEKEWIRERMDERSIYLFICLVKYGRMDKSDFFLYLI
ncbi:hypothetical protein COCNU_06G003250 [Cocos nucifera]|uniref:Uncharacterized protein n=1 Tax=Cocos nucifera TaxID=13894 RepID=A0A8K0IA37_COCNU|nr:hypothetical protein COCNU_06G003250 [Cocos nucifera]